MLTIIFINIMETIQKDNLINYTFRNDALYYSLYQGKPCMIMEKIYKGTRYEKSPFDESIIEIKSETCERYYKLLIDNMQKCSHPNLIKYIDSNNDFIVMEYPGIPLSKYLQKDKLYLTKYQQNYIIFQLAKALEYLESINMYHLFLKPDNIFFDPNTDTIKLFDYGIEAIDRKPLEWAYEHYNIYEFSISKPLRTFYETRRKEDVWIFGLICFQVCMSENVSTLGFRYNWYDSLTKYFLYPRAPVIIERCQDKKIENIVRRCLTWEEQRPTMKEILVFVEELFTFKAC